MTTATGGSGTSSTVTSAPFYLPDNLIPKVVVV